MLAIRLQRVGRKNDPSFRVIVADSKLKPKTGNVLEVLGSYNARMGKPVINIDRAKHWMSVGAKASGTVHNLLVDLKAVTGKKINVLGKKTPIIKEVPAKEVKASAPAVDVKAEEKKEEVPESSDESAESLLEARPDAVEAEAQVAETAVETPVA